MWGGNEKLEGGNVGGKEEKEGKGKKKVASTINEEKTST